MKLLSLLVLFGLTVQANTRISKFTGKTYKAENLSQCLADFDYITNKLDNINGFRVLEGGCQNILGNKFVKIELRYMHPLTKKVETFKTKLADEATCAAQIISANQAIINSGNTALTTFCRGTEINVAHIDDTFSMIRSLKSLGRYLTMDECSKFLKDLDLKAQTFKMTSIVSTCSTVKTYNAETYYVPTFNYISRFDNEIEMMNGLSSDQAGACSSIQTEIQSNFSLNNVSIVKSYCTQISTKRVQSKILYVEPQSPRYIEDYKALDVQTANACRTNLTSIKDGLIAIGYGILNSYCQKLDENKYRPMITYIRTLEI